MDNSGNEIQMSSNNIQARYSQYIRWICGHPRDLILSGGKALQLKYNSILKLIQIHKYLNDAPMPELTTHPVEPMDCGPSIEEGASTFLLIVCQFQIVLLGILEASSCRWHDICSNHGDTRRRVQYQSRFPAWPCAIILFNVGILTYQHSLVDTESKDDAC